MPGAQYLFRLCLPTPTSFGSEFIRKALGEGTSTEASGLEEGFRALGWSRWAGTQVGWVGVGAVLKPHLQSQQSVCITGFIFPKSCSERTRRVGRAGGAYLWQDERGKLKRVLSHLVNGHFEMEPCPRGLALCLKCLLSSLTLASFCLSVTFLPFSDF